MFPDAAGKAMQSAIGDAGHSMEEVLEVKGQAAFPALDMVGILSTVNMPTVEEAAALLIDSTSRLCLSADGSQGCLLCPTVVSGSK